MREISPGIFHWKTRHPRIQVDVSSYFVAGSATLVDPLLPGDDVARLGDWRPERIVLTNRHHLRSSEAIAREHGCPIRCHEAGLHEFEGGPDVKGFAWGERLAPDVTALGVDAICDEETALRIDVGDGFLALADAIVRYGNELAFVPDRLLGDDPEAVKRGIRAAFARLLDEPFDSLLFAHGDPLVCGGHEALRRFVEQGSG